MPYAAFPQNTSSHVRSHLEASIPVVILPPIAQDAVEVGLVRLVLPAAFQASTRSTRLLELHRVSK